MINLASPFKEAKARLSEWNMQKFRNLLSQIEDQPDGLRISWDEGAGEDWASALTKEGVAAILRVDEPLAVVIGDGSKDIGNLAAKHGVVVIQARSWDGEDYCLDPSVVIEIFPNWVWRLGSAVSLDRFSIWDLWWATI